MRWFQRLLSLLTTILLIGLVLSMNAKANSLAQAQAAKSHNACTTLPKVYENSRSPQTERPFAFLTARELRAIVQSMVKYNRCIATVIVRRKPHHLHILWAPKE